MFVHRADHLVRRAIFHTPTLAWLCRLPSANAMALAYTSHRAMMNGCHYVEEYLNRGLYVEKSSWSCIEPSVRMETRLDRMMSMNVKIYAALLLFMLRWHDQTIPILVNNV